MAQMLAMVCNEHQNDWEVHLPHECDKVTITPQGKSQLTITTR